MLPSRPPYSLEPITFRFAALAAAAGRATLGGARESVLTAFIIARLADDTLRCTALHGQDRKARVEATRSWVGSMALPNDVRTAAVAAISAVDETGPMPVSALRRVISVTAKYMDAAARADLERLSDSLAAQIIAG